MPSFWWVNQGQTGDVEQRSKFIWAPQKNVNGQSFHHWRNVGLVKSGDVILHYTDGFLTHVGCAIADSYESSRPNERGMEKWDALGWRCDLELIGISPPVSRNAAAKIIKKRERDYSPITNLGTVNQGYLFKLQIEDVAEILHEHVDLLKWICDRGIVFPESEKEESSSVMEICILPKPFLILAGISGTGKTRWVRKIAEKTGDGISNYCLVPVRPDWHEPSDLMGYVSRIGDEKFVSTRFLDFLVTAWKDVLDKGGKEQKAESVAKMTPHWVCLDEMNLAPVEQYFSDFLSILETRDWDDGSYKCDPILSFDRENLPLLKKRLTETEDGRDFEPITEDLWNFFVEKGGIPLPPNLIVVGTVNMDETTHAFSRKVLDRAFTVEFEPADVCNSYWEGETIDPVLGIAKDASISAAAVLSTATSGVGVTGIVKEKVVALVDAWNRSMDETPFRVAYRTLNEALLYVSAKHDAEKDEARKTFAIHSALDDILMMKLLPRLEGDAEKLACDPVDLSKDDSFPTDARASLLAKLWDKLPDLLGDAWGSAEKPGKSRKKLHYMAKRLQRSGYTSFWP